MQTLRGREAEAFVRKLEKRGDAGFAKVESRVHRIVSDVRRGGDRALRRYSKQWDGLGPRQSIRVSHLELRRAWDESGFGFKNSLRVAAANIRRYCEWQQPLGWRKRPGPGILVGQVVRPLQAVGCYVPGGRYPLPSTLLMTVIPAQVAGVPEIRVVSPR